MLLRGIAQSPVSGNRAVEVVGEVSLNLENLLQLRNDRIAHLLCTRRSLELLGSDPAVESGLDRGLDGISLPGEVERVTEHHGNRQNGSDRVDDTLAGDIWGRACSLLA